MITLEHMLESSVHLGHSVKQYNPKMRPFIYGERNGIYIIDVLQTLICLNKVSLFLKNSKKSNKKILFVCTKKQFSSLIQHCSKKLNSFYITERWLGGMLTNWNTIKKGVDKLNLLLQDEQESKFLNLSKKEILLFKKKREKLEKYLNGIKDMQTLPDIVIIVGQKKELNAIKECLKLNITLITILDTNCDPTLTDFLIPANDDSITSVQVILESLISLV